MMELPIGVAELIEVDGLDASIIKWMEHVRFWRGYFCGAPSMGAVSFVEVMDFLGRYHGVRVCGIRPRMEKLERMGLVSHFLSSTGTDRWALADQVEVELCEN